MGRAIIKKSSLATSTVGMGWLISKIWGRSDPQDQVKQSNLSERTSLVDYQAKKTSVHLEGQFPSFYAK